MALTYGHARHHLADWFSAMEANPPAFDFYQAMRLMECLYADRARLGTAASPSGEPPIRLGQEPAMSFESASLTTFLPGNKETAARLLVRFLGLLGPNGPLPLHLTEYARMRQLNHKDPTFARFLDIFNHRMLSLFYRARANSEPTTSADRPESDRFAVYIGALAGLGMSTLRNRDDVSDLTKFHYCGRLACQTKNTDGLRAILSDYFGMTVRIEEFVGEWIELPEHLVSRLGGSPADGKLGRSITIGTRIWGCQHKFRIILGPMDLENYRSFLPGRRRIGDLAALVRNYIGDELSWDIQLRLNREEVPPARLDGRTHLGWTAWIGRINRNIHADDLIFNPLPGPETARRSPAGFRHTADGLFDIAADAGPDRESREHGDTPDGPGNGNREWTQFKQPLKTSGIAT